MSSYANEMPAMVNDQLAALSPAERASFDEEYARHRKSTLWAYVTWAVGWHFGYIERRWGFNVVYLLLLGPTFGIWALVELFKVRGRLRHQRADAAIAALRDLRAVSAQPQHAVAV